MAQHDTIDLSVEEQRQLFCMRSFNQNIVKQYSLAQEIGVSVQSLTKLLDDLENDLASYQLILYRKRGEGYILMAPNQRNVSS